MTLLKVNNRPPVKNWNGLVNDLFRDFETVLQPQVERNFASPLTNVAETRDGYHVEILAPGRDKALFEIKVENNELVVRYEGSTKSGEARDGENPLNQLRQEFTLGNFKRSFVLDEKVNHEGIQAKYEDGLLKLYIPKKENALPVSQTIQIQ